MIGRIAARTARTAAALPLRRAAHAQLPLQLRTYASDSDKSSLGEAASKAKEAASGAADKVKDAASGVSAKANETYSKASDAVSKATDKKPQEDGLYGPPEGTPDPDWWVAAKAKMAAQEAGEVVEEASDKAQHVKEKVAAGGDVPWAIGSLLFFGSLFYYLTSPKKDGEHGHDDGHAPKKDDHDSKKPRVEDASAGLDLGEVAKSKTESKEQHDDAPAGNKVLAAQSHDVEGDTAPKQKTSAEPKSKPSGDNTTFQTAVAAAKEGHKGGEDSHISDPKKVVAAAKTKKEEKKEEVE